MKSGRIVSPMALGNGAYLVHRLIENHLNEYRVIGYNPYWTLLPFLLPLIPNVGTKQKSNPNLYFPNLNTNTLDKQIPTNQTPVSYVLQ